MYYRIDMLVILDDREDHDELKDELTKLTALFMQSKRGRFSCGITGGIISETEAFTLIEQRREQALQNAQETDDAHVEFGGKVHVHKEPN